MSLDVDTTGFKYPERRAVLHTEAWINKGELSYRDIGLAS